ncbi:NAD-dependent formate dehydrogenase, delta subunit [Pseudooceanicola batsensis HTCC2597]|uniref:NAD-dependent formate dehydrogenase, delta subunit n=1 Tax=Pseudooceanicola batsensis (strain ATCC BAA-863 / DSM 15984 / KCTC 12145 / HTCC2597) TaxID=252305 RepID=A3TTJ7_PSEBH|nr:formate dehydrogenase subunit delta [Pseudooceanicola batsensis]EAQ04974.1 NAD-dependent formate dehydrogenase, delta subunit [Pseudooceanicola batsensis HTCC2597]
MSPEKMVTMANQIATFFASQPGDDQALRTAAHINDFWDPRMRRHLLDHLAAGGEGLKPLVREAQPHIAAPAATA